jgi:hypothetical protein
MKEREQGEGEKKEVDIKKKYLLIESERANGEERIKERTERDKEKRDKYKEERYMDT